MDRQFCRRGIHSAVPAVTLTFDNGARRLHWCAEHAADAEQYRGQADATPALRNRVTDQATRTDADALRDTPHQGQGARVHAADADHQKQMRRRGLVGPRGGLTRKGSIAAERLRAAALDDAFGAL